jgi:hypothetical protein
VKWFHDKYCLVHRFNYVGITEIYRHHADIHRSQLYKVRDLKMYILS